MFNPKLCCLLWLITPFALGNALEEVVVSAQRSETQTNEFAGSIAVIDSQQISAALANHIQQSLNTVAGVNLHRNSGQEYLPAIRSPVLTGAGACGSFLIAEDGIPLRPAGLCNVNELFESHWQQAERIEIIKGPSSALFGSNALHGVVNVITPTPNATRAHSLTVNANSLNQYTTQLAINTNKHSVLLSATKDEGYRHSTQVDEQKLSLKSTFATTNLNINTGITLTNLNQETAGFIVGLNSYQNDALIKTNANPEAYRDAQAVRAWATITPEPNNRYWQITPYVRWNRMDFLQHFLPGTPLERNGHTSFGVQSLREFSYDSTEFIVGLDGEVADGWLTQFQASPTTGSPFLMATIPQGYHYDYQVDVVQVSPFVQIDQSWTDRLSTTLGLRAEWLRYDYDNQLPVGRTRDDGSACDFGGCRYSRPADRSDDFFNLSPKASASYQHNDTHQFYVTVARVFRVPQATELYRLQREQQVADLQSEQLSSVELGWRAQQGNWQQQLALFAQQKSHLIYRNSDFFNLDNGKSRHRGIELSLTYALNPRTTLNFAGTLVRHQYDFNDSESGIVSGNDVDTAPRRLGNLGVKWQALPQLQLQTQWQFVSEYFTDPENNHKYSGHNLLNLSAQYQLDADTLWFFRISNLLDTRYAERADFTSFSGDRYMPGTPRALHVAVEQSW